MAAALVAGGAVRAGEAATRVLSPGYAFPQPLTRVTIVI
jgi:hypothetical protein